MQDQLARIEVNGMQATPSFLQFGLVGSAMLVLFAPGPVKAMALMGLILGVG